MLNKMSSLQEKKKVSLKTKGFIIVAQSVQTAMSLNKRSIDITCYL